MRTGVQMKDVIKLTSVSSLTDARAGEKNVPLLDYTESVSGILG